MPQADAARSCRATSSASTPASSNPVIAARSGVPIIPANAFAAAPMAGGSGPTGVISQYCTFGGTVGASVIATRRKPRSQGIFHVPRRAFSTSNAPSARHAPSLALMASSLLAAGLNWRVQEQVVCRDRLRFAIVPTVDEPVHRHPGGGERGCKEIPEFLFIFAMMMAFFYAMMAELTGLSAIVGAFIAGVSFEGVRLKHCRDIKEGAEYLQIIFASIFFVSLGVLADFRQLTPGIVIFLVALIVVAIITKLVGCGVPAKLMGMSTKDSLIVGFGMAPRGEVAMIVALIGLQQGIIDQNIYVALVLMSLVTTIITPIMYRNWLYRGEAVVSDIDDPYPCK